MMFVPLGVQAAVCTAMACMADDTVENVATNCASFTKIKWGNKCIQYCATCSSGSLTDETYSNTNSGCSNSLQIKTCQSSSGTSCSATAYGSSTCGSTPAYTLSNCASPTKKCFGGYYVQTCDECSSGTRTQKTYKPSGCSNSYTYYDCTSSGSIGDGDVSQFCISSADCTAGVGTTEITGGTKTVTGLCNKNACTYTTTYNCVAGYYAFSSVWENLSGCSKCAVPGTSEAGADSATDCFVPAGTLVSDDTGDYKFNSPCYYTSDGLGGGTGLRPIL